MKAFLIPYVILVRFMILSQHTYEPFISDPNYNVIFYKFDKIIGKVESETFSIGDKLTHCNAFSEGINLEKTYPFQMVAGYVDVLRKAFILTKCLNSLSKWSKETTFYKCHVFTSSLIIGIIEILEEEIIAISCNTPSQDVIKEILISDYPRLQVSRLYSDQQRGNIKHSPDMYLSHGMKIHCYSSDPFVTHFIWQKQKDNELPNFAKGQILVIEIDKTQELILSKYPLNTYTCSLSFYANESFYLAKLWFSFYVEYDFQIDIQDDKGKFGRREFDVGETIQCVVRNTSYKKGDRFIILYNPEPVILLTDINTKQNVLQSPAKRLTFASQPSVVPGGNIYLKCFILGDAESSYDIKGMLITLLTNKVSEFYSYKLPNGVEAMHCLNNLDKVYIFRSDIYQLPLSKLLNNAEFISVYDNYSVKMDFQWSALEWYFVVCFDSNDGMAKTPVVLNIGREPVLIIESVFPPYNQLTRYQMKGFVYKCYTNNNNFSVEWSCSQCLPNEMQKIIYTGSKLSMDLEIITDTKMEITYVCRATLPNNKYIEKNLSLSLQGPLLVGLVKPRYFYTFDDPVRCSGIEMYSDTMTKIVLPVKLIYENSTHKFEESTALGTDPFNRRAWTPIIPLHLDYQNSPWKFSACCIKYDMGKMVCGPIVNIEVIVSYILKYNYDIPGQTIYPGNIMKCCILRRNSLEPNKASMDGDALYNCLPAQILFYANKDRSATPANPGVLMYEGTQISVPEEFEGNDITRAAAFVKCYSDDHSRKATDLLTSVIQLTMKSCKVSLPPVGLFPQSQTFFTVGNIILCFSLISECPAGMFFDFRVERGGELVEEVPNSLYLILTNMHLGKNIKLTCKLSMHTWPSASRLITIEGAPYNLVINGSKKIMTNNKMITCSSEGFPTPSIIWTDVEKQSYLLIDESTIIIRNWDKNGKYVYTCTALNKHGEISQTITFHIFNINMKDSIVSVKFYVILYLELFLYFVFILFILTFIFKEYLTAPEGPRFLIKGVN